jgi:hypothetical protein
LNPAAIAIALTVLLGGALPCQAHHVLGRPAYSLSEDSNTPPSMAVETQIGEYFVTYMVFPAFPQANEPGRLNLYASRIDNGEVFQGTVTFSVRDNGWFDTSEREILGTQEIDDGVYRQGFLFSEDGKYLVRAEFEAGGEPYLIDLPLQIGEPSPVGTVVLSAGSIVAILLLVNLAQRKKLLRAKVQSART